MTVLRDRAGRPRSFDQDELIAAALRLGPSNLALRNVADELQVPRTTIYNHVRSVEQLGRLVLSSILAESEAALSDPRPDLPWQEQLEQFAFEYRDGLHAAGPWIRFFDAEAHISPLALRWADGLFRSLTDSGFTADEALLALRFIHAVVSSSVNARSRRLDGTDGSSAFHGRLRQETYGWVVHATADGDPERLEDEQFRYNLRRAIAGIAAELDHRGPS